jgi:hypothetical protein
VLGYLSSPEWLYAHFILLSALSVIIAYQTFFQEEITSRYAKSVSIGLMFCALFLIISIRLYTLAYVPQVDITDEPWVMSWSVSYVKSGTFEHTIMLYEVPVYRYYVIQAAWFKLLGIGLYQGRLLSFLLILIQSVFVYHAGSNFFNRYVGGFAAALMLVSPNVLVAARMRHDAAISFFVVVSVWAYSRAYRRWSLWWWHLLAGLFIGLGAFAHYHAAGFGVALTLGLYVPSWLERGRKENRWLPERAALAFIAGGLLGFLCVVILQIIPSIGGDTLALAVRQPDSIGAFFEGFILHLRTITVHSQLEAIMMLAALFAAFRRRTGIDVRLAITVILMQLFFAVMSGPEFVFDY